jgi:DNA-binding transcriptional ArsR family regulator
MVDRLAASGPISIRELAAGIGKRPSALYRHLGMLLEVGLVVEAGTRVVRRKQEKLYATPAPRMRLIHALGDPRLADLMVQLVATLGRQMTRDFAHGISRSEARHLGDDRNLGLFRLVGAPGPKALAAINRRLDEILEILLEPPDPKAPFLALTWTLSPVRSRSAPAPRASKRGRAT